MLVLVFISLGALGVMSALPVQWSFLTAFLGGSSAAGGHRDCQFSRKPGRYSKSSIDRLAEGSDAEFECGNVRYRHLPSRVRSCCIELSGTACESLNVPR